MAPAPKIAAGAVRIARLNKLSKEKRKVDIQLATVHIELDECLPIRHNPELVMELNAIAAKHKTLKTQDTNSEHVAEYVTRTAMKAKDFT